MNTLQLGLIQGNLRCFGTNCNMSRNTRLFCNFVLLKYSSLCYISRFFHLCLGIYWGYFGDIFEISSEHLVGAYLRSSSGHFFLGYYSHDEIQKFTTDLSHANIATDTQFTPRHIISKILLEEQQDDTFYNSKNKNLAVDEKLVPIVAMSDPS